MKKLKLFISLWFTMFSMVVFGQAEYEKIAITANTQDNSALKVNVQSSSNEINWKYIKDFQKEKEYLSTGLIKSGVISINSDNTKYNISAGIGIITNFDDPENPTSTIVNFPAVVAKTPSYLTTSNITYVAINSNGTVTESATPFTPEQRRTLIILGAVIHSNLTNINVVNNISAPTNASTNQLHDLMEAIGALNLSGNKFGPNNANLLMNKSAGTIFKLGSNFVNDWKNPHVLGQAALTGLTFRYRTQNGTESSDLTSINPNVYDLNNVLTAVPSNRYSIQTITLFQSGLVRVQYGQNTYATISEAEAAISTRNFNVESNIALNGITRAYLLVKEGTTSLSNPTYAKFVDAGKFGSITSGGGAITLSAIIAALGYTPENVANKQNSLATDGSGVKYPTVDAVNTKVSNIDNTSDLNKPISTATQTALNLKENTANKNIANGYAGLGSDGKLISSQLPSITITDTFVVGSQSAMLSLVAETGDVAVRTDVNKSFILQGDTPSDLADWQELLTPTSTVSSVFGRTGAVTANSGDYTADQISETASRKFQTLAQQTYNDATSSIQTQLNGKEPSISAPGTTGQYWRGNKTWATLDTSVIPENGPLFFTDARARTAVTGNSGTTNYISKFTGNSTLGNSLIYDNGSSIGINTTSPNGNFTIQSIDTRAEYSQTSSTNFYTEYLNTSRITSVDHSTYAKNLYFYTRPSSYSLAMSILSSGNVGIGTTSPVEKLEIISSGAYNTIYSGSNGNGASGFAFSTDNRENTWFIGSRKDIFGGASGTDRFNLLYGTNSILTATTSGNVGIGTPSPVDYSIFGYGANIENRGGRGGGFVSTDAEGNNRMVMSVDRSSVVGQIKTVTNTPLTFGVNDAERMRITSGGDVFIGSTVAANSEKLGVNFDSTSRLGIVLNDTYTGVGSSNNVLFKRNGSNVGSISTTTTTTSYNITSDYRLKQDFKPFNGLDLISKFKIYDFAWKTDNSRMYGGIAHEIQEVVPYAVTGEKDGEKMQQVDYSKLVPILIQSIQELKAEIEILKNK